MRPGQRRNWGAGAVSVALALATLALPGCAGSDDAPEDQALSAAEDSARLDSLLQRRRAYEKTRAEACENLFRRDSAKWSNVLGWKYDQGVDGCYLIYEHQPPKTEAECDSMFPPDATTFMIDRSLCHEGRFRQRF